LENQPHIKRSRKGAISQIKGIRRKNPGKKKKIITLRKPTKSDPNRSTRQRSGKGQNPGKQKKKQKGTPASQKRDLYRHRKRSKTPVEGTNKYKPTLGKSTEKPSKIEIGKKGGRVKRGIRQSEKLLPNGEKPKKKKNKAAHRWTQTIEAKRRGSEGGGGGGGRGGGGRPARMGKNRFQ